jgi:hypothetical protein
MMHVKIRVNSLSFMASCRILPCGIIPLALAANPAYPGKEPA